MSHRLILAPRSTTIRSNVRRGFSRQFRRFGGRRSWIFGVYEGRIRRRAGRSWIRLEWRQLDHRMGRRRPCFEQDRCFSIVIGRALVFGSTCRREVAILRRWRRLPCSDRRWPSTDWLWDELSYNEKPNYFLYELWHLKIIGKYIEIYPKIVIVYLCSIHINIKIIIITWLFRNKNINMIKILRITQYENLLLLWIEIIMFCMRWCETC